MMLFVQKDVESFENHQINILEIFYPIKFIYLFIYFLRPEEMEFG